MPYLTEKEKEQLNHNASMKKAGHLTYNIQQLLKRYWVNSERSYQVIAEILGALRGATMDFEDRIVRPYEKQKREENGDAW